MLLRRVVYEEVYLKDYASPQEAREGLSGYFGFYNDDRPHQALGYRTPAQVYYGRREGKRQPQSYRGTVAGTPVALRAPYVPATVIV